MKQIQWHRIYDCLAKVNRILYFKFKDFYVDAVDETDLTKFVKITEPIMTSPFLDVSINKL